MEPANASTVRLLLRQGRFGAARTVLADRTETWALIQRSRLAFFLDNDRAAAAEFAMMAQQSTSAGERLLATALLSCARTDERVWDVADLVDVEPQMIAEVVYYIAFAAYLRRDFAGAGRWLGVHAPAEVAMQARYMLLGAQLAAAGEDFPGAAERTAQALDLLRREAREEHYLIANAAHTLAWLAREVSVARGVETLESIVDLLSADDGATSSRLHVRRSLGWNCSIRGDAVAAYQHLTRALSDASTTIERLWVYLDLTSASIFSGEQGSSATQAAFALAMRCAGEIPWHDVVTDDLAALPLAAQVASEFGDAARARSFCVLADTHATQISRRFSLAHDRRLGALIAEAAALSHATFDPAHAARAAREAYDVFASIGFAWRAGRMAILLLQLERTADWRRRADEHLGSYRDSPLRRLLGPNPKQVLTPRQVEILRLLLEAASTEAIAERLGMASNTVRVHLGRIYRFYGVRGRSELLARRPLYRDAV